MTFFNRHVPAPRAATRLRLALLAAGLVAVAAVVVSMSLAQAQSGNGVYDTDGDRLIEIDNLDQLHAMRSDDDGDGYADNDGDRDAYAIGFPLSEGQLVCDRSCNGYELKRSLDFADPGSYASGTVNPGWQRGAGWAPNHAFGAIFDGNGHTISNLYLDVTLQTEQGYAGLFGWTNYGAVIRDVGLLNVEITGVSHVGGLVGWNGAEVTRSYVTGTVSGTGNNIGGLVGTNRATVSLSHSTATVTGSGANSDEVGGLVGQNYHTISESYATGAVTGDDWVGGLVGHNGYDDKVSGVISLSYANGAVTGDYYVGGLAGGSYGKHGKPRSVISSSYATGSVNGTSEVGGLVGRAGWCGDGSCHGAHDRLLSTITGSYAIGAVAGNLRVGGIVGYGRVTRLYPRLTAITVSYWNTDSRIAIGIGGGGATGAEGKSTAELQEPTGRTGIYAAWSSRNWDFGTATQYPALKADINNDGVATAAEFGGQGRDPSVGTPTATPTAKYYKDFSIGPNHICLLTGDGSVECAGDDSHGQASPPASGSYIRIDGGDTHTCGQRADGMVECWGSISGTFNIANPPPPTPTPSPTATPAPTATPTS